MFNEKERQISPDLSNNLNFCRWIAALLVMIGHLRDFLFVGADKLVKSSFSVKGFYFITGFNHHAVIIFFVMSGFLVGGNVLDKFITYSFHWRKYIIDRTTRIYIVFIIALIIGGLLDYIGLTYFNQLGLYNHSHQYHFNCDFGNRDVSQSLNSVSLMGNLMMLQALIVPVFGSNGPLWSLAYEWWYYVLFPLLAMIFFQNSFLSKIMCAFGAVCIMMIMPLNCILYFWVWLMGVVVRSGIIPSLVGRIPGFLLFIIAMVVIRVFGSDSMYLDYLLGALFALYINEVYKSQVKMPRIHEIIVKINSRLAGFSYSMYVLHIPFILLIMNIMYVLFGSAIKRQPTVQSGLWFIGIIGLTYTYSFGMSLLTENKTIFIRNFLYRRFFGGNNLTSNSR